MAEFTGPGRPALWLFVHLVVHLFGELAEAPVIGRRKGGLWWASWVGAVHSRTNLDMLGLSVAVAAGIMR